MDSQNIILPPSLRSEDVNEIKNTFIVFAGSEEGKLSVKEFEATVNSMKESDKSLLILQLLDDMLALHLDEIDYDTFYQLVTAESNKCNAASLFKLFDVAAVGSITASNLKKIARELGITVSEEELNEMIKRADVDNDGEVNEKEFTDFMMQSNQYSVCIKHNTTNILDRVVEDVDNSVEDIDSIQVDHKERAEEHEQAVLQGSPEQAVLPGVLVFVLETD